MWPSGIWFPDIRRKKILFKHLLLESLQAARTLEACGTSRLALKLVGSQTNCPYFVDRNADCPSNVEMAFSGWNLCVFRKHPGLAEHPQHTKSNSGRLMLLVCCQIWITAIWIVQNVLDCSKCLGLFKIQKFQVQIQNDLD